MYVYAKNICKYTKFCTVLSKLEKRSWSACASSIGVIFCDSSVNAQMSSCSTCVCVCVCVCVCGMCVYITTFCGSSLSAQISSCSAHVYTHAYIFA